MNYCKLILIYSYNITINKEFKKMDNRDMFFNTYGYSTGYPNNQMFQPNMMLGNQNNYNNDLNNRLTLIERQITRLKERVSKLENPNYNEPDNNLYML